MLEQTSRATPTAALLSYRDFNSNADFRSRIRWSTSWVRNNWSATALMTRAGSFPVWQPAIAQAYGLQSRIGPNILWNASVGHQVSENIGVRFSVNNVFDHIHPQYRTMNSYPYYFQAYDPIGREVGLEVTYRMR